MKKTYTVVSKVSKSEIKVKDVFGRERLFNTTTNFNIGDSILVVNGVVIGSVRQESTQIFEV